MAPPGETKKLHQPTKKCPYCATYVKRDATRCDFCNRKIGEINEYGVAKKPFNFMSYVVAIGAVAVLVGYLVYAFGR